MSDVDLSPERRERVALHVAEALERVVPASVVTRRGSLAAGTADAYSDIDLLWVVPDHQFARAVGRLPAALASVGSLLQMRTDPALAASDRRRLVFAHLRELPAYWRVDLDVRARSVAAVEDYDVDNPSTYDESGWNWASSALANAVAAVKALRRGRPDEAAGLVSRALERVGCDAGPVGDPVVALAVLVEACLAYDPGVAEFAAVVARLVGDMRLAGGGGVPRLPGVDPVQHGGR